MIFAFHRTDRITSRSNIPINKAYLTSQHENIIPRTSLYTHSIYSRIGRMKRTSIIIPGDIFPFTIIREIWLKLFYFFAQTIFLTYFLYNMLLTLFMLIFFTYVLWIGIIDKKDFHHFHRFLCWSFHNIIFYSPIHLFAIACIYLHNGNYYLSLPL